MNVFALSEAREILAATPGVMRALFSGLSETWVRSAPAPGAWAPSDVLGHLIHGEETDWIPRSKIMLEHGTSKPFEPFDREGWSAVSGFSTVELLDTFVALRARSLEALDGFGLDAARLDARGIHPAFGEVRLQDMLATWAVHDLSHIAQITESMAKRYAEAVGPWRRYLPVLDREELESD